MSILCYLFGHKSLEHTFSGAEYMTATPGTIDGIGREHATLYARCPRCGERHRAGQIHLPQREAERTAMKRCVQEYDRAGGEFIKALTDTLDGKEANFGTVYLPWRKVQHRVLALLKARDERDEADRRAGAAQRHIEFIEEHASRHREWMRKAKAEAGYDQNTSFDVVWADALAALQRERGIKS